MRRAAMLIALLALAAPAAAGAQAPPLRAKLTACQSGPQAANRVATFTGSMPAVKGTRRMWMRFDLLRRVPPAETFTPVKTTGLGVWHKSASGRASGFVFDQRVQALAAPGAYRAVVRFRWYGADVALLRSARRVTGTCTQPDQRPDVRAGLFGAAPGPAADQATYQLVVFNGGRTAAGPFAVGLRVAGVDQPSGRVPTGLAAGTSATLTFVAPACAPGSTVRFTLDARSEVAEAAEADNAVVRPCPLGA
jgi:hypothetical protein